MINIFYLSFSKAINFHNFKRILNISIASFNCIFSTTGIFIIYSIYLILKMEIDLWGVYAAKEGGFSKWKNIYYKDQKNKTFYTSRVLKKSRVKCIPFYSKQNISL